MKIDDNAAALQDHLVLLESGEESAQLCVQVLFLDILCDDRVQGVPQFVGDASVDKLQE